MGRCRLLSAIISWLPLSPPEASGTGPAFPLFTRVLIGKAHSLLNYELDPQAMASQCFDLDRPEQSVYQSMSDIEEARAVAAHFLTLTERNQFEPRVAIRIYRKELEQCSIGLSVVGEVPGTTGYTPVDRMHFDLRGDRDSFQRLAKLIVNDFVAGGDRFRHVGTYQLSRFIQGFLDEDAHLTQKRKSRCQRLISSSKIQSLGQGAPGQSPGAAKKAHDTPDTQ